MSIRLNKLLAQRGIGARRACDALILEGRVAVNGATVTQPGTRVEPERDRVTVAGRPLPGAAPLRYFALNKPVGVITTLDDPEGRRTIRDLLPPGARLFPVGRLDADTSGLLVLTNDGDLAHHLMHPRYGVEKVYRVRLDRMPDAQQIARLRHGVEFEPGVVSGPARVRVIAREHDGPVIEIVIHEGRYRQVRRMCEAVGLAVRGLHRAAYGPLRLGPLARGMWRELSDEEVRRLRAASARARPRPSRTGPGERRGRRRAPPATPGAEARRERVPRSGAERPRGEREQRVRGERPGRERRGRDFGERPTRGAGERLRAERPRRGPAAPRDRTTPRGQFAPRDRSVPRGRFTPRDRSAPRARTTPRARTAPRDRTTPRGQFTPRDRTTPRDRFTPRDRSAPRERFTPRDRTTPRDRPASRDRFTPRERSAPRDRPAPRGRLSPSRESGRSDRRPVRGRPVDRGGRERRGPAPRPMRRRRPDL